MTSVVRQQVSCVEKPHHVLLSYKYNVLYKLNRSPKKRNKIINLKR